MKKILLATLVFILIALNWNSIKELTPTGKATVEIPEENNNSIEVYFCPTDDCEGELIKTIEMASEKVHCAFYDVDLENVKDSMVEARRKGVDMKLIVDADNKEFFEGYKWMRPDDRTAIMHNKFCIVDDSIVWTGSFNPTYRGAYKNNNNALRIKSAVLAANYEAEFDEMWNGEFGKGPEVEEPIVALDGKRVENYFCPEDWCANKVLRVIEGAQESVEFMTFSFTYDELGDAIIAKYDSGIKVRGVFEKTQNNAYTEYSKMEAEGMDVRWDGNPANMHHKVFVIDGKIVVTGSFNPSNNGNKNNDENILIIYDKEVAQKYNQEFERIWNQAKI